MINIFAWMATSAAVCAIIPSIVLGLAKYWNPLYLPHRWQDFLIFQASNIVILIYNIGILRRAAWTHDVGMALSLIMMLTYLIVCLARASPKRPSSYVWTEFVNDGTGWSNGVVFLTGLVNPHFGFVGIDGAIHLAEDAKNTATAVPWALAATVLIGFFTAFPFVVAMFYCISDPGTVLSSPVPIFEIWRQAIRSDQGATAMTALLVLTGYFALNASQQTASRLTWSFARDGGLVFSGAIGNVHPTLGVPVWALFANAFVVFIMGCVYLGSTAAFNSIVATSLILMHITFAIPAALKMLRQRAPALLPEKSPGWSWNLGLWGWVFDSITVAWSVMTLIFYCFPTTTPTAGSTANYAAAVLAVMALFAVVNWFAYARKHYKGPRVNLERFRDARLLT
jgi:choline transport protein